MHASIWFIVLYAKSPMSFATNFQDRYPISPVWLWLLQPSSCFHAWLAPSPTWASVPHSKLPPNRLFFFFSSTGVLIQGLTLARHMLYHLSCSVNPQSGLLIYRDL
jgi:hypothetical protein